MMSYPPMMVPQTPAPYRPPAPPAGANEQARAKGRRYQIIFGAVFAGLTVLALVIAALAPSLRPTASGTLPAGWTPVYQHDLTVADNAAWDLTKGCAFNEAGLDASATGSSATICDFMSAGAGGATTQGFYFEAEIAPAATVPAFERALLLVGVTSNQSGDALAFEVDQQGRYVLCDTSCAPGRGIYISGGTAAWHGDAFVANTFAVRVSPDHTHETFFVNGQQVATATANLGAQPALALGAPSGSDALFTRATLSTGQ